MMVKSSKNISVLLLFSLLFFDSKSVYAQSKDSIIQFVFTSDVHFGLTKENFRGQKNVSAATVNKAMADEINQLSTKNFPLDNGVQSNKSIKYLDAIVITGDIANRMENGIQSATKSWNEFSTVFVEGLKIKKNIKDKSDLLIVPGNHDMSNAIGFHRPMQPKKDPASMLGIYNLMFPNEKKLTVFDSTVCRIHFSRDIKGVHFIFLSLWPDSTEQVWIEKDLKKVSKSTPVLLFAHSVPYVEARFFVNPNGDHDINETDKFENLVPEMYKDGFDVKGETLIEQKSFAAFIKKHPSIKAYFHGHENFTEYYHWKGPDSTINLSCIRTDSPMKGKSSAKDESKLAYEIVSINTISKVLTVREVLWNTTASAGVLKWGESINIKL